MQGIFKSLYLLFCKGLFARTQMQGIFLAFGLMQGISSFLQGKNSLQKAIFLVVEFLVLQGTFITNLKLHVCV
ncbi:hypothetical protein RchiOBHm_Chr7g0194771 [Rosa chinensis]|uniref:Uncharacterized protein n=1 Tax=Rosa chinensis TaxID=74649 RepID=A0A2P6P655_ROSCH|nr:hypothetical protein RchiOBHm_Chr7g0194771 [Rosa chinensis]